ncbi:hypothetical protein HELRODRAFT_164762 [Helobdella robusta]|uniref:Uncharacterized protein n=1 Tax=Helobdella robusta TaxID=6412 RepID=T1EVS2_HELRO|nr:hypothetical protein HELRODRAFT_164762 [Helobdella robusta]ESN92677.1 hypothetical protein HELRODRAFT_164762 [Helobdella robusta]
MEKNSAKSNKKEDKMLGIVTIILQLNKNILLESLPTYVSVNFSKIPSMDNILNINFNKIKLEIKEILYKQELYIAKLLENMNINYVNYLASKPTCTAPEYHTLEIVLPSKLNKSILLTTDNRVNNNNNFSSNNSGDNNGSNNSTLWADVRTPTENIDQPFTAVQSKKRPRLNITPEMVERSNVNNGSIIKSAIENMMEKPVRKIIGNKKNDELCKIKANKMLIKKSFFSMSNVQKCHRNDVMEYLKSIDINVISCFPVQKRTDSPANESPNNDDCESTMFRVCVESSDPAKMKNPDVILQHIIVKEWRFNPKKTDDKNNNKHEE